MIFTNVRQGFLDGLVIARVGILLGIDHRLLDALGQVHTVETLELVHAQSANQVLVERVSIGGVIGIEMGQVGRRHRMVIEEDLGPGKRLLVDEFGQFKENVVSARVVLPTGDVKEFAGDELASYVADADACAEEAFADRGYTARGTLVPRGEPRALVQDPAAVAERASRIARERTVVAVDGTVVRVTADTLCLHGDTPGAAVLAEAIRRRLALDGVQVTALRAAGR